MTADPAHPAVRPAEEATLRPGAIGFLDALVIWLASTSPAYSLAAILGALVALTGVNAPGVLLASFLPMLLIAAAFAALNRVDPDCGTTFSWVTRAMGPWVGWLGGWAIAMTGIQPSHGPIARVTQENVVPQSGSTRLSAANAAAISSIGMNDARRTPGALIPVRATSAPRIAARE